jgi:hypothetical protein
LINIRGKQKRFQVTRFTALLTTGMHGIEHRVPKRRAFQPLSSSTGGFSTTGIKALKLRRNLLRYGAGGS